MRSARKVKHFRKAKNEKTNKKPELKSVVPLPRCRSEKCFTFRLVSHLHLGVLKALLQHLHLGALIALFDRLEATRAGSRGSEADTQMKFGLAEVTQRKKLCYFSPCCRWVKNA